MHNTHGRASAPALLIAFIAGTQIVAAAELPVMKVTLYKHGLALFEREGTIPSGEQVRLEFQNNDMNDLLKSLVVSDSAGHIKGIRYDANETLDQRLSKFPFRVGDNQALSAFLDTLKGSRIELTVGPRNLAGSIVGARGIPAANGGVREQISLFTEAGELANYDLTDIASFRLLDPHQQGELKTYLQTLADSTARDRRSVFIEDDNRDTRQLRASYIAPAPIWKSSYRLTLDGTAPMLEGWAIVDNTTNDDWNNIQLSVVSGRPISFISPLDTARYGQRDVAQLPEDKAAGPVIYGGSVDIQSGAGQGFGAGNGGGSGGGQGGGAFKASAGVVGGVIGGVAVDGNGPVPAAPRQFVANQLATPEQVSTVQGATGASIGELFQYSFPERITVKKNQSAMLPFLQSKVQARKLLIYTDRDSEHPVNAAELTNSCGKTLDGGPVTVYDGGAYGGEALFETLKAGDKRLIGYAVDYGTRVTSQFGSNGQRIREVHAANGDLSVRYALRQLRNYTIRNVDAKAKTLIVQQDAGGQEIVSPKPLERTSDAYRFEVKLPADGTQSLKVETESTTFSSFVLSDLTADNLLVYLENESVPTQAQAALKSIADRKHRLADSQSALQNLHTQLGELSTDQSRLRANIESLNRVSGEQDRVHAYAQQLAAFESRMADLRVKEQDMTAEQIKIKADLDSEIRALRFDPTH